MSRLPAAAAWASFLCLAGMAAVSARALSVTDRPGFEYMPDMARSLPYDSFDENPVTGDGKTLRAPVAGTVPRGHQPFRYRPTPEDAERAGRELANPVPATPQALARGRALYGTFCWVCHGERGAGDGPLVPKIPNPPAYTSERVRAMAPGQLYHVISAGAGRMPGYAAQITPAERWLIVHYVRTLQEPREASP